MSQETADLITVLTDRALAVATRTGRPPSTVRLTAGDVSVEITWPDAAPAASTVDVEPVAAADPDAVPLCSETVGVFYRAPEPGAEPFVSEGDLVAPGQQVGIVEAMKLMIPLKATHGGRVARILVADGQSVEHGQPVILLRAA